MASRRLTVVWETCCGTAGVTGAILPSNKQSIYYVFQHTQK